MNWRQWTEVVRQTRIRWARGEGEAMEIGWNLMRSWAWTWKIVEFCR